MLIDSETLTKTGLIEGYRCARARTEDLCKPLAFDDYQVQSIPEASPPKWHLAHVTWFFETFLLQAYWPDDRPLDPRFTLLFNSYYVTVGAPHPRAHRYTLSRPTVGEVYRYRAHVDEHVCELIERCPGEQWDEVSRHLTLGIHYEQQHQELLLMDVKRNFFRQPALSGLFRSWRALRRRAGRMRLARVLRRHPGDRPRRRRVLLRQRSAEA